jgi:uncharacterized SAM-binding protein YcdF (DUF218 family)
MARTNEPPNRSLGDWFHAAFLCSSLFVAIPAIASFVISGRSSLEKVLTQMAQPLFAICFFLFSCSLVLARRDEKGTSRLLFFAALLLWAVCTPYCGQWLVRRWESQTTSVAIEEMKPFDVIVVLGGGSGTRPTGDPQLNGAGDRVGFAARMYHLGLTKKLVTTGEVLQLKGTSVQTKRMWIELGIPADAIETIGGENTYSEMLELSRKPEWLEGKRCGLVTSAMHMPRALGLAERAGLRLEPIAVDFESGPATHPLTIGSFLPSTGTAGVLGNLFKEWIAMRLGR